MTFDGLKPPVSRFNIISSKVPHITINDAHIETTFIDFVGLNDEIDCQPTIPQICRCIRVYHGSRKCTIQIKKQVIQRNPVRYRDICYMIYSNTLIIIRIYEELMAHGMYNLFYTELT